MRHGSQPLDAEVDREQFRRHVAESERLKRAGDVSAANRETAAVEALIAPWKDQGRAVELLSALLGDPEPESVRFSAATCLLGAGYPEIAIPALEAIRDNTDGIASLDARMIVDYWRRQNA